MIDEDIEQLSTFMGHTGLVHRDKYRLADDIFQTAKVSKLLLMMECGQAGKFKGKRLEEINLDMEQDVYTEGTLNETDELEEMEPNVDQDLNTPTVTEQPITSQSATPSSNIEKSVRLAEEHTPKKKNTFQRQMWSDEEKSLALSFFSENIRLKTPPKRRECDQLIEQNPTVFKNRRWPKIKVFIHNFYSKKS